ncbi:MAG TPA: D-alanyl-D-alanine carboxypeptidase [Caulobacteraceae bacterium]|jgi:D-alanyl-D-alanine carboxypeptidase (penicillin-binding protein 5/6)|nr:D-alanyl-D-alanine carboxypeptidase [Caulobacteraceae bacterium]
MLEPARRVALAVAVLAAAFSPVLATTAKAQAPYLSVPTSEPKYTAIVVDARSGEVLYAKRADSPRYPASITKIMTMYLAFEAMASGRIRSTDLITVSPRAAAQAPTKLGLRPGDTISVEDALHAIAVKSANDMAVAVAEHLGGTESRFAALMTLKAQELGMQNTRFVNASGLPDSRQISSARDIAILSRSVMRDYPQYYSYFSQETFVFRGQAMNNHNGLLGKMPGVDGLKTGFTNAAGYNLAASAVRNGNRLIAVVMGGSSGAARNANVEDLLLTGFDVMERRARGERILVAQSMFEPTAPSVMAAIKPQTSQGDTNDPIDLVLTRNTTRPGAITVAPTMQLATATPMRAGLTPDTGMRPGYMTPPATIRSASPPPRREARNWSVQVGSFKSKREARAQVEEVARRFSRIFDNAEGSVDAGGRHYQARFSGFTESEAREACSAVKAKRIPCAAGRG